jgi:hypothetical protein
MAFGRDGLLMELGNSVRCTECGKTLTTEEERDNHFHRVRKISKNPPIYLISLSLDCLPGSWQAAKALSEGITEVLRSTQVHFQFVPFTQVNGGMETLLAIGEFYDKSW